MPPKLKPILDQMASQIRSQLSLPDDPITALPAKTTKPTKKPSKKPDPVTAIALAIDSVPRPSSVLVETVPAGDETKSSASVSTGTTTLFENPGAMVPAPRGVAQVDITGGRATFALAYAIRPNKDSAKNEIEEKNAPTDKKPGNDDSALNGDKKNNKKKNDKSGPAVPHTFDDFFYP